jgi:hypothetical protein
MPRGPARFPAAFLGSVLAVGIVSVIAGPAGEEPPSGQPVAVDATTLRHKVLCGYQS